MDNKFAVCGGENSAGAGSWKAPSRDLYGTSDSAYPVVGDGTSLEWDTYPPTAGLDQKLSCGFGSKAPDLSPRCGAGSQLKPYVHGVWPLPAPGGSRVPLVGGITDETPDAFLLCASDGLEPALRSAGFVAANGAGSPSLDSLKNNRHTRTVPAYYQRPVGRGKFCGRWSVKGLDPTTGRQVFRRVNCGSWSCSYCGARKARTARAAIRAKAEELGLKYFLTLTLDPKKLANKKFQVPYLRLCFNKFREYLKRKFGVCPSYICVLEFTKAGVPHLHILFDRYIPQGWISNTWGSLGGGRIVFIKQVTVQNVARYLSKYLTKELLLSAPKGTRRITTARSIKLFPKFASPIAWALVKESIYRALEDVNGREFFTREQSLFKYVTIEFDEEKYPKKFEIVREC